MDKSEIVEIPEMPGGSPNPHTVDVLIECWWADHFPGSPVAQLTPAWNHALAAKEDLKRRFASFAGGVA